MKNSKKPRKQNNSHGVNLAREFMRKELVGDNMLTDSDGNYLAPTDIAALWDDATIAKKFDVGVTTVLNIRRDLKIPNAYERRKTILSNLRQTVHKSPAGPEEPKDSLPAWCKVDAWVTDLCPKHSIGVIEHISGEWITVRMKKHPIGKTRVEGCFEAFSPIRFCAYTFEEAKGLLGKVMEYSFDEGPFCERSERSLLITLVSNGKCGVLINGDSFITLSKLFNATINGVPIGVPEVDEEALKGGEE